MNDIVRLLDELAISPADLARRLGVSEGTVSRWRSGTHAPSGLYAQKVAELAAQAAIARRNADRGDDVAATSEHLLDLVAPQPGLRDDDYSRGYQQGYRDAVARVLAGLAGRGPVPP